MKDWKLSGELWKELLRLADLLKRTWLTHFNSSQFTSQHFQGLVGRDSDTKNLRICNLFCMSPLFGFSAEIEVLCLTYLDTVFVPMKIAISWVSRCLCPGAPAAPRLTPRPRARWPRGGSPEADRALWRNLRGSASRHAELRSWGG